MEKRIDIFIQRHFPGEREVIWESLREHQSIQELMNDYIVYQECIDLLARGVTVRETGLKEFYKESRDEIEDILLRHIHSIISEEKLVS